MYKVLLFLISLIMYACSTEQAYNDPLAHFLKVTKTMLKINSRIDLEKYEVYKPWDVIKQGKRYYVYDEGSRRVAFTLLDDEKGTVKQGVSIGDGPGELRFIERLLLEVSNVTVYDGVNQKRYLILEDEDSCLYVEPFVDVGVELISFPAFCGEKMAAKSFVGDSWIHYYINNKEKGTGSFPSFEETDKLQNEEKVSLFRNGQQKFSPDGTKLASCISDGCAIAMYDCNESSFKEIKMLEYFPPIFTFVDYDFQKTAITTHNKVGFVDIACTNKYVYALYSGKRLEDGLFSAYYGSYVFVYDWNGNPIIQYELEEDLFKLNIDESEGILYGPANVPEGCIVEYKL